MNLHRRAMITAGAAAVAAPALAAKAKDPLAGWTVVNTLGGFVDLNVPQDGPTVISPRMLADARASGLTAVNCTLGYVFGPEAPYETTLADIRHYDALIAAH